MKKTEINNAIRKYILPKLNDYHVWDNILYKQWNDLFIKGYYFYSSGDNEVGLTATCLILPLFLKREHIIFNFSEPITFKSKQNIFQSKETEHWNVKKEEQQATFEKISDVILRKWEPYLDTFKKASDFYKTYKSQIGENIRIYEAVAYCTILMEDEELQNKSLKGLIEFTPDDDREWVIQLKKDAEFLLNTNTKDRLSILREWALETLINIKLPQKNIVI